MVTVSYLAHYDTLFLNVTDIITKCDSNFNTKCDKRLLQNASGFLFQNATVLLQNATVITKCVEFFTKCDSYYKIPRLLQNVLVQSLVYTPLLLRLLPETLIFFY